VRSPICPPFFTLILSDTACLSAPGLYVAQPAEGGVGGRGLDAEGLDPSTDTHSTTTTAHTATFTTATAPTAPATPTATRRLDANDNT